MNHKKIFFYLLITILFSGCSQEQNVEINFTNQIDNVINVIITDETILVDNKPNDDVIFENAPDIYDDSIITLPPHEEHIQPPEDTHQTTSETTFPPETTTSATTTTYTTTTTQTAATTPSNALSFGTTVSDSITATTDSNRYSVSLSQPGRLSIIVNRDTLSDYGVNLNLVDSYGTRIGGTSNGRSYNSHFDLETGTYYIEIVKRSNSYTGTYNIRVDFISAGNNEIALNNTRDNAHILTAGQTVKGFISRQNERDFYSFSVSQPGRLAITVNRDTLDDYGVNLNLLDSYGTRIGGTSNGRSYNSHFDLETGIYYIEIVRRSTGYTGTYNIKVDFVSAGNDEIPLNNTRDNAHTLILGKTVRGFISRQNERDTYRFDISHAGRFTITVNRDTLDDYGINLNLLDSHGTRIGGTSNGRSFNNSFDFETGIYYIEIVRRSTGYTGTYNITVSFT